jgi:hypothetical protein
MTLSTLEYPTETKVRIALQSKLLELNGPVSYRKENRPTFGLVIDRFIESERLTEILAQPPGQVTITDGVAYSTASGYISYLRKHIRPRWGTTLVAEMEPLEIQEWLRTLMLAPKTKGHIKNLMSLLFDRAKLWKLGADNPMGLVKVKGVSKRLKRRGILTADEYVRIVALLQDPYRTMFILATCTGLRVSEILALTWERLDFPRRNDARLGGRGKWPDRSLQDGRLDRRRASGRRSCTSSPQLENEVRDFCGIALPFCSYWRLPACRPDPAESHPTCRHKNWSGRSGLAYLPSYATDLPLTRQVLRSVCSSA